MTLYTFYWFMFQLLSAPFAYQNAAVSENTFSSRDWIGKVDKEDIGQWIDSFLLLLLGGIPWQVFSFYWNHRLKYILISFLTYNSFSGKRKFFQNFPFVKYTIFLVWVTRMEMCNKYIIQNFWHDIGIWCSFIAYSDTMLIFCINLYFI
jgi:hypothetical protein